MIIKLLFPLFFMTPFLAASEIITLTQEEQNYLKTKKEITIGYRPTGLPLFAYENGKGIGIQPDIIHLLEAKIGVPFRTLPTQSWKECIDLTKAHKVDLAAIIIISPNKQIHLTPSHKIIEGFIGIATKMQTTLVGDLTKLKDKRIALLKEQTNLNHFVQHKLPDFDYVMVDTIEEGLELVAKDND